MDKSILDMLENIYFKSIIFKVYSRTNQTQIWLEMVDEL
jgi:hypothetical protein